ncbi:cytochrome c [Cellulophaga sp. F20128]|uniref:c-type cytochrome n=1 Tax=Cellulophaga sp. F20128 TaxID=2926413 RepID=UPI001FF5128A|nr:cytochrome c [Cellulophaga sp. F20128]MCK0157410.1 cytochrome c [Cellulophaga sp. F20128]
MKKILVILAVSAFVVSCGGKKEEKKEDGFEMNRTKKADNAAKVEEGVPVDMENKGVGPITSVKLDAEVNTELAAKGEAIFGTTCIACHTVETRLIGPAIKGVMERRSPEWVMNMILNPEGMLKEDVIAKALFKEYNNALMTNQGLTEEQARSLVEYFRTL